MILATSIQLIATLTKYPEILIAGRVIGSFFSPMCDSVLILYLQEISPVKIRGALSSLCATGYFVMALFGMMLGMKNILGHNLTILLGVPIPPGLAALAFLLYLPETPKFLMIVKQNRLAAKKSLVFYQGDQPTNDEILDEFIYETKNEPDAKGSLSDLLFVPYLRKALLLANAMLVLTVPFFAILLSSTYFLMEIDIPSHVAQLSSTFLAVVLILTCFIATYLLKSFGRRPLLNFSGIGSIISLCVFAIAGKFYEQNDIMKYIALSGMVGYMVCYGYDY
uniref:Major facilitator superfamily (MFS) profile domain-containing protein n=1 Tax=Acrobeloides nanus TaxID=290746 RepID=A0A914E2U4_9BILA